MQTHFVGLCRPPGQIQPARTALPGADGILPVEAGHKVAARIAHDGHIQFADQVDHVAAKAVRVSRRVTRLIDAAVHSAAQVLDEGAIQALVDLPDGKITVQDHFCFFH
ncbi:hypothetical protein SDC9_163867 [bioreactor metagenome]|uniref:Uncharacterized protein n=1 Tax=bioreactor metagenome TaxID=1076179 RepID=A0A645FX81_9ZZZZ